MKNLDAPADTRRMGIVHETLERDLRRARGVVREHRPVLRRNPGAAELLASMEDDHVRTAPAAVAAAAGATS